MNGRLLRVKIHVLTWGYNFEIVEWFWQGYVHVPPPPEKNMCGLFPHVYFFPCVENILGLSQLTNISGGTHAFAASVVPNNNVALAEFERLNLLIHIVAYFHVMLRKSTK